MDSSTEKINIVSIIGNNICVAAEDGQKVHAVISEALLKGKSVEISFKGIEDITSLFLNTAIGLLYNKFQEDDLRKRLTVINADPQDLDTLKRSVERAKEYFKDPERFHSATEEILGDDDE
jgi:hypothetical protein